MANLGYVCFGRFFGAEPIMGRGRVSVLDALHSRLPIPPSDLNDLNDSNRGKKGILEDRRTTVAAVMESVEVWRHTPDGQGDLNTAIRKYREAMETPPAEM